MKSKIEINKEKSIKPKVGFSEKSIELVSL